MSKNGPKDRKIMQIVLINRIADFVPEMALGSQDSGFGIQEKNQDGKQGERRVFLRSFFFLMPEA